MKLRAQMMAPSEASAVRLPPEGAFRYRFPYDRLMGTVTFVTALYVKHAMRCEAPACGRAPEREVVMQLANDRVGSIVLCAEHCTLHCTHTDGP